MTRAPANDPRRLWVWILIFAVALVLRVIGLGGQSYWVDEAYSIHSAKLDRSLLWGDFVANLHGPLHAVILHNWAKLFGDSEVSFRLPSVLASLLTLPALWHLVRRLAGEKAAWVSVVALALAPMAVWYAQEARNYSMLLLFATLAFLTWLRLLEKPGSPGRIALHVLSLFLGFLSNLAALFIIPVQAFWLLGKKKSQWAATLGVWVLLAILLLPWETRFYNTRVMESGVLGQSVEQSAPVDPPKMRGTLWGIPFTLLTFAGGTSLGPSFHSLHVDRWGAVKRNLWTIIPAALVFGGLALWGLFGPAIRSRRKRLNLLAWLLIPLVCVWLLALANLKEQNPRYAFAAFPAFLALVAAGWVGLPSWRTRVVSGLLVLVMWGVALVRVQTVPEYRKEDFRSAAPWLRDHVGPETLWVSIGIDAPLRVYYMRDLFDGRKILTGEYRRMGIFWAALGDKFWNELEKLTPNYSKILLFECRTYEFNHEERLREFMEEHCSGSAKEEQWNGIRARVCDTRGALQAGRDG